MINLINSSNNESINRALIIVDMQNDFANSYGSMYISGAEKLSNKIKSLLSDYETIVYTQDYHPSDHCSFYDNINTTILSEKTLSLYPNQTLIQIRNTIPLFGKVILKNGEIQTLWPKHCVQNTWGVKLINSLNPTEKDFIVHKGSNKNVDSYSAFFDNARINETPLHNYLQSKNIKKVDIVGLAFDYCVGYTALDAKDLGYETRIITSATKSVCLNSKNFMEQKLTACGVELINK